MIIMYFFFTTILLLNVLIGKFRSYLILLLPRIETNCYPTF